MNKNFDKLRVLQYIFIVFILSWFIAWVIYVNGGLNTVATVLLYPYMLVPALGTFVMRKFITREGFQDAGLRLGKARYYFIGWLLPIACVAAAYSITLLIGLGRLDWNMPALPDQIRQLIASKLSMPVLFLLMCAVNIGPALILGSIFTFGEEFGWRSHLLVKLMPSGKLSALIIHGAIWGIWHAPIIMMGHNYPGYPPIGVLLMTIFCILLGIIFGWLYLASGSVFPCALAHATINNMASPFSLIIVGFDPRIGGITGLVGMSVLFIVIVILYLTGSFDKIGTTNP